MQDPGVVGTHGVARAPLVERFQQAFRRLAERRRFANQHGDGVGRAALLEKLLTHTRRSDA